MHKKTNHWVKKGTRNTENEGKFPQRAFSKGNWNKSNNLSKQHYSKCNDFKRYFYNIFKYGPIAFIPNSHSVKTILHWKGIGGMGLGDNIIPSRQNVCWMFNLTHGKGVWYPEIHTSDSLPYAFFSMWNIKWLWEEMNLRLIF